MSAGAAAAAPHQAVIVTGASTGIGRATALWLAERGTIVYAGVRKDADGAALLEAAGAGTTLRPLIVDVTDAASIAAAAARVDEELGRAGRLVGLVNNAGIVVAGPLEFLNLDGLRRQLEVNVVGQVAVTQAFLPRLRADGGRVVHIGSSSGRFAAPFVGAYAASKFAMEAVADAMRRELRPWRIPVVLVEPGAIATPIWQKSDAAAEEQLAAWSDEARERYAEAIEAVRAEVARTTERATPAEVVARTVHRALFARRPRPRYLVGSGARMQDLLARFVPDRWVDVLVSRALGW